MKKIFLSLSLMMAGGLTSSFTTAEPIVSERVQEAFQKEFGRAQSVKWTEAGDYMKASFLLGDHRAEAYYDADGELAGCTRDLFYDQLPLLVMTSVDKRFSGADIIDVREISNAEGTTYRLTLEYKNKRVKVKTNAQGTIVETEKLKK